VQLWKRDVAGIADLPPLPELSYDDYDAAEESDHLSDLCGADGKPPICLKQTEVSLKHFAKRMGQPNYSAFYKGKKVWVGGFLELKHLSIIQWQNGLKQVQAGPLQWDTAAADCSVTFETWLPLDNFANAKWSCCQWVAMCVKKCASEIRDARKKGR
jgi:hypothetical protein